MKTKGTEKMERDIRDRILEKILEYDTVMLFRHKRMDGDCVGAAKGLQGILRRSFPGKRVLLIDGQRSAALAFAGPDDGEVPEETYRQALGIVVDTATRDRISNPRYALCRELVKIDHHIETDPYADLCWVEEERPSACEMIADFYVRFRDRLVLDAEAAGHLYMGMVTDTGRFRTAGVNGETLRLAAGMLDAGVDTERLYGNLYLKDFSYYKFIAHIYEVMEKTENGVAYAFVDLDTQDRFGMTFEDASKAIVCLDAIRGCLCALAFIQCPDPEEGIRVRLRSRYVAVDGLAGRYRGGGHAFASGSTVYSREEALRLVSDADALVKEYKETHADWM